MFKSFWCMMFCLVLRLLHESTCQPGVKMEWSTAPESPALPFISLLPDSVSDIKRLISLIIIQSLHQLFVEYVKHELLNAPQRLLCLSTMQLSSQSNTLPFFLPSFLSAGFTSTSAQRVLGHSECLCSKLRGVKQSCGHAVTTLSPTGPQSSCL